MKTPDEVMNEIRTYFASKGMTNQDVANTLKMSPQAVTNMYRKKMYLGGNAAAKWSAAFGFDYRFLRTGEGSLFPEQPQPEDEDGVFIPAKALKLFEDMQATCRNLSELALGRRDPDLYEIKKDRPEDSPVKKI